MNIFQHYLAEEFAEDYAEGRLTRRQALKLIISVTGSVVWANSLLVACVPSLPAKPTATFPATVTSPVTASAATTSLAPSAPPTSAPPTPFPPVSGTVSPDDPAIQAGAIEFVGADDATLLGYLAQPMGAGPYAVVLVCHENRGLTPHIQDVTRRLAKTGYIALAVDLLSRQGGTEAVGSSNVPGALGNLAPNQFVQDFRSGWQYLQALPAADIARVGMVGFCFGGGVTWLVATQMPELKAAVPFYGPHPALADVPNINAPVLAIYAERDQRINQGIAAIEAAMQQNNQVYEKEIYPDSDHAFHNDTGSRYNPEAAQAAWARALNWFERYLAP